MPRSKTQVNYDLESGFGGRSSGGMGRGFGSSNGRLFGSSRAKPTSSRQTHAKAPPTGHAVPTPSAAQFSAPAFAYRPPSLMNGLLWGVGMGAGSEIGHAAVKTVTGSHKEPGTIQEEVKGQPQAQRQEEYHPCTMFSASFLNVSEGKLSFIVFEAKRK